MWPNFFTGFPFPFPSIGRANFNTLPTVAVTVGTENVTLELPNHAFRNRDYVGGFYISLRQAIPAGTTATLPILIVSTSINNMKMAFTLADNVDVEVTVLRFCSNFMEFGIR